LRFSGRTFLRRRGPRSLERHYLRLGALAHQEERGSVRHHLAAAVQHRGAQRPRHRIADRMRPDTVRRLRTTRDILRPIQVLSVGGNESRPDNVIGEGLRLGEMSDDDAQPLHRGSGGSTYTRKARATREAPERGQVRDDRTNRTPVRDRPGALRWQNPRRRLCRPPQAAMRGAMWDWLGELVSHFQQPLGFRGAVGCLYAATNQS
jgi:hypothetical protein